MKKNSLTNEKNNNKMNDETLQRALETGIAAALEALHLDNLKAETTDISEGETDMAKRIKKKVSIGGKEIWITGESDAELFERYRQRLIEAGELVQREEPAKQTTFQEYAESYMNHSKRNGQIRHTTLAGYESSLKNHLYPFFGNMSLSDIAVQTVEEFIATKRQYAKKTIHEMMLVLTFILDGAIEDGLIKGINPAKSKRARNYVSAKKKEIREPYTEKQMNEIISHIKDLEQLRDRRLIACLCFMPVRREDVLGLRLKDFDLERMELRIERSVTFALHAFVDPVTGTAYKAGQAVIGEPKTEAGFRVIPIVDSLLEFLELSEDELKDGERFLIHHRKSVYEPYTGQSMKSAWARIKKQINLYGKTPHYFRHTFATIGQRKGISARTMQAIGGWKDGEVLNRIYTHTQSEDIQIARGQMAAMYLPPN